MLFKSISNFQQDVKEHTNVNEVSVLVALVESNDLDTNVTVLIATFQNATKASFLEKLVAQLLNPNEPIGPGYHTPAL
jgi:hypothetical protein